MRRTTFSVVFFCKKARISKKGKAPIYARITTSGLSTETYTRCQIEPERWNQRLERSLHRDKVALQINGIVDSYRANILAAYDALIREGRIPDCFTIKERLENPGGTTRLFLAEFSKYCEKRQQEVGTRITQLTANKYHRLLRYMTEYIRQVYGKEDLPLETIDYAYIDGLNTHMQTRHKCKNNGAVNLLCCLKNFILYAIRKTSVVSGEAGGITQHIGAYQVQVDGRPITFLDTPGHAAFTSMRARGAQVTDIAVLVVAADDGIMPQTVEAINHAKEAGVSIIVAINKMDKPEANPERIKQQLTEYELVPEEWGGDTICVPVSAKTGMGLDNLLEMILLVADTMELTANPNRMAKGTVIEAKLDTGRGPVATVLIQTGTLHSGEAIIAGTAVGRVRVMTNDKGQKVEEAGPSCPVEITGLAEVPAAGDIFNAVEDEKLARELVEKRRMEQKEEEFKRYQKVTLDNLFEHISEGEVLELPVIVKGDVQGSVEAVRQSLEKLSNDEVRVRVIHGAVGAVSESDVMLANASHAIIVGFNVRPDPTAKANAERDGVEIRLYRIIYDAIEEIEAAMKGMLKPKTEEVDLGRAEIRNVYKITGVGAVAGCYVLDGKMVRSANIRVVRDGIIIADDKMVNIKLSSFLMQR